MLNTQSKISLIALGVTKIKEPKFGGGTTGSVTLNNKKCQFEIATYSQSRCYSVFYKKRLIVRATSITQFAEMINFWN